MIDQRPPGAVSTAVAAIDPHCVNVVAFPGSTKAADPFGTLTARLILDQHRRGVLQEGVLLALLAAATGFRP